MRPPMAVRRGHNDGEATCRMLMERRRRRLRCRFGMEQTDGRTDGRIAALLKWTGCVTANRRYKLQSYYMAECAYVDDVQRVFTLRSSATNVPLINRTPSSAPTLSTGRTRTSGPPSAKDRAQNSYSDLTTVNNLHVYIAPLSRLYQGYWQSRQIMSNLCIISCTDNKLGTCEVAYQSSD